MDIFENLFIPNVRIYTNVYDEKCPVQVAEFQPHSKEWKFVFNLGVQSLAYIAIYASKIFTEEQVRQMAAHLNSEVRTKGYAEGTINFAKTFAHHKIEQANDFRLRNVGIDTTKEELEMIKNIQSLSV